MRFIVSPAFKIDRKPNNHVDATRKSRARFWRTVEEEWEGLKDASGCYVFGLKTGGGPVPWYVGKAERQSFEKEIFAIHKLHHYDDVLAGIKGTPYVFLIPCITPTERYCKPTRNRNASIRFLETLLIGMAIRRNPRLKNAKDTSLLRTLRVRGLINSDIKGHPGGGATDLRETLGIK
jgi:hypothetical protein